LSVRFTSTPPTSNDLRLAYAEHVYKAQGATVDEVGRILQERQEQEQGCDRYLGDGVE
jgi:hypothetical protein